MYNYVSHFNEFGTTDNICSVLYSTCIQAKCSAVLLFLSINDVSVFSSATNNSEMTYKINETKQAHSCVILQDAE